MQDCSRAMQMYKHVLDILWNDTLIETSYVV